MIPGRTNTFEITIREEGRWVGRCAELCGEKHDRMNFFVRAVSPEAYDRFVSDQKAPGAAPAASTACPHRELLVTLIAGATTPVQTRRPSPGPGAKVVKVLTTTDHKTIGLLYLVTSFLFFLFAGFLAMLMRAELAQPGLQVVSNEQYNQLFTMHGSIMMFLFAPAAAYGFANFIMPLQIGAPDMSFPRLNAFSYWLYLFGGPIVVAGFLTPDGAADFGWFAYAPLSRHHPLARASASDLWIIGLTIAGLGTILGAVNFITTIITLRAPGMTMFRMPIFTWNMLVTSILALMSFPVIAAAFLALMADRHLGAHVYDARTAGRSSTSTCSGSSATPRSTSSRCRSSA